MDIFCCPALSSRRTGRRGDTQRGIDDGFGRRRAAACASFGGTGRQRPWSSRASGSSDQHTGIGHFGFGQRGAATISWFGCGQRSWSTTASGSGDRHLGIGLCGDWRHGLRPGPRVRRQHQWPSRFGGQHFGSGAAAVARHDRGRHQPSRSTRASGSSDMHFGIGH